MARARASCLFLCTLVATPFVLKDAPGPQGAAANKQFEERSARGSGDPQEKYRKVLPPEECQQDEQVQQFQVS